jgi:hypothetical protein
VNTPLRRQSAAVWSRPHEAAVVGGTNRLYVTNLGYYV